MAWCVSICDYRYVDQNYDEIFCNCNNGWEGYACHAECPGGEENSCSGHGNCYLDQYSQAAACDCGYDDSTLRWSDYDCHYLAQTYTNSYFHRIWQVTPTSTRMPLLDARDYCDNLELEGFFNWRVPTIDDVRTLITNCDSTGPYSSCMLHDACSHSISNCTGCPSETGNCYWPEALNGSCTGGTVFPNYWVNTPDSHPEAAAQDLYWHVDFLHRAFLDSTVLSLYVRPLSP